MRGDSKGESAESAKMRGNPKGKVQKVQKCVGLPSRKCKHAWGFQGESAESAEMRLGGPAGGGGPAQARAAASAFCYFLHFPEGIPTVFLQ